MNIKSERCFNNTFRLTVVSPKSPYYGKRYVIRGEEWCRQTSIEAKNLIAVETGVERKNIRFI
jgi:DNA/RNA endonuclease G (NUC1)